MFDAEHAVVVQLPLRGEWTAVRSPGSKVPSHGTDILGQRYAFDFVRLDQRGRYADASWLRGAVVGVPTRDCYGWGEPIHAAADGEVVAAVDGIAERARVQVVRELGAVLRTMARFDRDNPWPVAGNYVLVASDVGHLLYAHLAPGTVAVRRGDRVAAGDVLGRVGHTGNSTAPHLHFHVMDGPDARTAAGVPAVLERYEVWRDGGWQLVERGVPTTAERIRSVG